MQDRVPGFVGTTSGLLGSIPPLPGGRDHAAQLPRNVLPARPATDVGKAALELHTAAESATQRLDEIREHAQAATAGAQQAAEALAAEIERSAREGANPERENELIVLLQTARVEADPSIAQLRINGAIRAQRGAVEAYVRYVKRYLAELIVGEFAPRAQKVADDLAAAEADTQKTTIATFKAAQAAYGEVRAAIQALSEYARQPTLFAQLPPAPAVPLPPAESYRADAPEPSPSRELAA